MGTSLIYGPFSSTPCLMTPVFEYFESHPRDENHTAQDNYESMKIIGERQVTAAKTIFERATEPLGAALGAGLVLPWSFVGDCLTGQCFLEPRKKPCLRRDIKGNSSLNLVVHAFINRRCMSCNFRSFLIHNP